MRRTLSVLFADVTRSQSHGTCFFPSDTIRDLFTPKIYSIFETDPYSPQKLTKEISFYLPRGSQHFFLTLGKIVKDLDNGGLIGLSQKDIETIYKGIPFLEAAHQKLERIQQFHEASGNEEKSRKTGFLMSNLKSLQHNLDTFSQEMLFPKAPQQHTGFRPRFLGGHRQT